MSYDSLAAWCGINTSSYSSVTLMGVYIQFVRSLVNCVQAFRIFYRHNPPKLNHFFEDPTHGNMCGVFVFLGWAYQRNSLTHIT